MLTTVLRSHLLGCETVSLGEWVPTFRMDHTAFVFRIKQPKENSSIPNLLGLLHPEMAIIRSSAPSGTTRPTIQSHIQEDLNFQSNLSNTIPCPKPDTSSPNLRICQTLFLVLSQTHPVPIFVLYLSQMKFVSFRHLHLSSICFLAKILNTFPISPVHIT